MSNSEQQDKEKKNWLEWTVFSFSLLLVLSILAYLGYQVYTQKPTDPEIYVEGNPDPTDHTPNRYHVTIRNKGGTTAEEVKVEIVLHKGGTELDKAELEIPFAPRESKREGWVVFSENVSEADSIAARVVSYKKP